MKVYLAAPFFKPAQVELVEKIETMLERHSFEVFSPRKVGGVLKDMPEAERMAALTKVFSSNVKGINDCYLMLAVIDDFDTGVVWEIGYAYALLAHGDRKVIATYTDKDYGLNVMLRESSKAHVRGLEKLDEFLTCVAANDDRAYIDFKNFNPQVT